MVLSVWVSLLRVRQWRVVTGQVLYCLNDSAARPQGDLPWSSRHFSAFAQRFILTILKMTHSYRGAAHWTRSPKRALLRCETAARHHAIQAYTTSFGVLDSFVSTTRNTWTAPSGNLARSPRLNPSSSRTSPQFRGWLPAPRFNEITFFMSNRTIVIGLIPPADTCTAPSPSIVTMACFLEIFCTAKTKAVVHSSRTA